MSETTPFRVEATDEPGKVRVHTDREGVAGTSAVVDAVEAINKIAEAAHLTVTFPAPDEPTPDPAPADGGETDAT